MPEPVYLTINEFPGTGAAAPTVVDFNFSGGYISRSHVKAEILDPLTAVRTPVPITDDSFVTDFRLSLPIVVPVGRTLRVYRKTPNEQPLVDFTNGARIAENNLDLVAKQAVFVSAEMADTVADLEVSEILVDISAAANGAAAALAAAEVAAAAASASADAADVSEAAALAAEVSAEAAAVSSAASAAAALASNGALAATLAAPGGSNQVGFVQAGTGAVARTAQSKMREVVSVKDFGAVGDGVANDTAAIQAAINSGAKRVTGVQGEQYSVTSLVLPSNFELDLNGSELKARAGSSFVVTNSAYSTGSNTAIAVRNGKIDGRKSALSNVKGVAVQRVTGFTLDNVEIVDCGLNGWFVGQTSSDITGTKVRVSGCGDNSLDTFEGCNINMLGWTADYPDGARILGVSLNDCESEDSWCHGFIAQFADNVTVTGGKYHHNGRGRLVNPPVYYSNGVTAGQVYGFQAHGVSSYQNFESGFDIAAKCIGVEMVGNNAHGNALDGFFCGHVTSRDYTLTGNVARGNARHGFNLSDTLYDAVLSSNIASNNGVDGFTLDAVTNIVLVGNRATNNTRYGFATAATASEIHFGVNHSSGNTVLNYALAATLGTAVGNPGLKSNMRVTGGAVAQLDRLSTFGTILELAKDGTNVVTIGHDAAGALITDLLGGQMFRWGTGTPEGAVTAPVGSAYLRKDGGAGTTLYIKQSGTGNTGWVGK